MRSLALLTVSLMLAAIAAGCEAGSYQEADYYGPGYYGPYDDVYYDGFYGPYPGGYWGDGGIFFYSDGNGHYDRDDGNHFRHRAFPQAQHFHASPRPDGSHRH